MWTRATLKTRAKNVLFQTYWISFAVCLLAGIIVGGVRAGININNSYGSGSGFNEIWRHPIVTTIVFGLLGAAAIVGTAIGLVYAFFVGNPVRVGMSHFFLSSRKGNVDFPKMFYAFKAGQYMDIVKAMAWRFLFTFLWLLALIIPGIIKAYAYSMVPYILADNPNIGYDRALKLSMDMTRGYKFRIFVLQLSFLGWFLLGLILCGVSVLFVMPYYEATMAELYGELRKNAVGQGFTSANELHLTQQDFMADNR